MKKKIKFILLFIVGKRKKDSYSCCALVVLQEASSCNLETYD